LDAVGERTRPPTGASFTCHTDTPKIIDLPQDRFNDHLRRSWNGRAPITSRSREQIADLLTGLDLVEPGIVRISDWHPEPGDESDPMAGAIGFTAVARRP
jgi:hypothetical protein